MSRSLKRAFSLIIGFFITLWIGIAYTLTLAFTHFEPVVDPNYSIKKAHPDPVAVAEHRSRWSLTSPLFEQDGHARGEMKFPLVLASRTGEKPESAEIEIKLERPATRLGGSVRNLELADARQDEAGRYHFETTMPMPAPGFWEVEVRAKLNGREPIFTRHRWYVQ